MKKNIGEIMKKLQFLGDGYKYSHKDLYEKGIKNVFTNMLARKFRFLKTDDEVIIAYGTNEVAKQLKEISDNFFNTPFDKEEYGRIVHGDKLITGDDWQELHDLGYLPIVVKAIKDGEQTSVQVPLLEIYVTDARFFWLGQYLETFFSQIYWPMVTSAVKSREIYKIGKKYTELTSDAEDNGWRFHDFGCRGHQGTEGSILMGQGHLLFNDGSDTTIAQARLGELYDDYTTNPIVNASEHSVMCSYGEEEEEKLFTDLLDRYEDNLLSIVIDGFDQDNFIYNLVPKYADRIRKRKLPLVLRPDSGDMTTTLYYYIKSLDDTFGHTVNSKGYKIVNNVNLIWGDGCTNENIEETLSVFKNFGYSIDNLLFGVGSFYYVNTTRDSLNMAVKATAIQLEDGTIRNTMKKVKSDPSKASLSGLVAVDKYGNVVQDIQSIEEFNRIDTRKTYFKDGETFLDKWEDIKKRAREEK